MAEPQGGIIPEPSEHARFLVLRVRDPQSSGPAVAAAVARVPALAGKVAGLPTETPPPPSSFPARIPH